MEECPEREVSVYERSMIGEAFLYKIWKCANMGKVDELLANTFNEEDEEYQVKIGECLLNIYHFCRFYGMVEGEFKSIKRDEPCKCCGDTISEETYSGHLSRMTELRLIKECNGAIYAHMALETMKSAACGAEDFFAICDAIVYREWRKNTDECYKLFDCPCKDIALK
jgi:hypothetical protein